MSWRRIEAAVILKPGDLVRHYAALKGAKDGNGRLVNGWSELGIVVDTFVPDYMAGLDGVHDCLVAFYGQNFPKQRRRMKNRPRTPYILRYANTSLELVRR